MNCYKVGDLMLYNNINDPPKTKTLVLILGIVNERHRKVMFLKNGFITKNCWVGYLLPVGDNHVSR